MKSKFYRKFRASKYTHKTRIVSSSGGAKGGVVVGHVSALQEIQQRLGRTITVHHIEKNRGQWIFCERKNSPT